MYDIKNDWWCFGICITYFWCFRSARNVTINCLFYTIGVIFLGFAMAIPNCWVVFMCQRSYVLLSFVLWNELSNDAIFGSLNCWFAVHRPDGKPQPCGCSVKGSPRGSACGSCGRHDPYDDGNGYEHLISMPCTTRCSIRCTVMPTCRPARTSDTRWPTAR